MSGTIEQRFTTPALEYRSTGTHLIWSSAARADPQSNTAPDLFWCEPGGPVSLLYDNPNRDSRLELIGGADGRVVIVEDNQRLFGPGHWKMWSIDAPGGEARLIDEGAGKLPFFDLSGPRLVWTVLRGDPMESQLWLLDLETMERRLVQSADATRTQYWFPSIDNQIVVYGALESGPNGQGEERHIYLLDVGGDSMPRRLDSGGSATEGPSEPDIHGDTVVWKESRLDASHLVGGRLVRYSLLTGNSEPVILDPSGPRYIEPSIGNRYVSAWSGYDRALYLGDLETGTALKIIDLGPTDDDDHDGVGLHAHLEGDLLAYFFSPSRGDLELRWIVLR